MKTFTKLVENNQNGRYFKIQCQVELVVQAANEGEAGYLADSELGSITSQSDFVISDISEITKDEYSQLMLIDTSNKNNNII